MFIRKKIERERERERERETEYKFINSYESIQHVNPSNTNKYA